MKKKVITIATVAILLATITLVFYSCRKKHNENIPDYNGYGATAVVGFPFIDTFPIEYITNSISYNGDFLQFSNRASFDYTMEELRNLDGNLYTPDSLQDSIGVNPILDRFECKFSGYKSLRKKIENEIDSLSEEGVYNPTGYDPDDHFIGDLMYRTVLNHLMEVQIAEEVYKVKSIDWVVKFPANDPSKLEFARNYNVSNLTLRVFDTLINGINFYYTGGMDNEGGFYNGHYYSGSKRSNCDADFTYTINQNGNVSFSGTCQLSCTYTWLFSDGGTAYGANVSHTFVKNGTYTVTMTAACGSETCGKIKEITITNAQSNNCNNAPVADFVINVLELGEVELESTTNHPEYTYVWEVDGNNETKKSGPGNYIFKKKTFSGGIFNICLTITTEDGCKSNKKCSTIVIPNGCCQRGQIQRKETWDYLNEKKMKYKIFRWNGGPLGRNVGGKTVNFNYRKRKFKIGKNKNKYWIRTRTEIYVGLSGRVWSGNHDIEVNEKSPCNYKHQVNTNEYKLSRVHADRVFNPSGGLDHTRVYTKKEAFTSTHWIKDGNGNYHTRTLQLTNCN